MPLVSPDRSSHSQPAPPPGPSSNPPRDLSNTTKAFRNAVTAIDFGKAYRDMVTPAIASGLGTDLDEGLDVSRSFAAIIANLDAPPASDESTAEVARGTVHFGGAQRTRHSHQCR